MLSTQTLYINVEAGAKQSVVTCDHRHSAAAVWMTTDDAHVRLG
jgi:hypothetical protein